jgi:MFS family permease
LGWPRIAVFLTIMLGFGSVGLGLAVIGPLLVPITKSTGNEQLSQVLVVMPFLGLALTGLVAGWVADRLGVRGTLCAGAFAFAAAGLVGFSGPPAPLMLAACFVVGGSAALLKVGAALLLGQNYEGAARSRVIGYAMAIAGLTASAAVVISGVIADLVGWRAAFLEFVVGGGLILTFALTAVRSSGHTPAEPAAAAEGPIKLALLAPVVPIFAAYALIMMVTNTTGTHVPLMLRDEGVHSNTAISSVLVAQTLCAMLGSFIYGWLQAQIGRFAVAALATTLIVVGAGLISISHVPVMFGVGASCFGLATGVLLPWLTEGIFAQAPLLVRGYAVGICSTAGYLGGFSNPFVMRPIREIVGLHGLYVVLAVATAVVGGATLLRNYGQGRAARRAGRIGAAKAVGSKP